MSWTLQNDMICDCPDVFLSGGTLTMSNYTISCCDLVVDPSFILEEDDGKFIINGNLFDGGGQTFNDVQFSDPLINVDILGNNTYDNVVIEYGKAIDIQSGTTQTLRNLIAIGTSENMITITTTGGGTHALEKYGGGHVIVYYCDISNSNASPEYSFYARNSIDSGGNTGWYIITGSTPCRPFAYNTGSTISGTTQFFDLAIGVDPMDYSGDPGVGGVKWWMGPDEQIGYVVAYSVPEMNHPTQWGNIAGVGFKRSGVPSDPSLLELLNYIRRIMGLSSLSTIGEARTWAGTVGLWISDIPT